MIWDRIVTAILQLNIGYLDIIDLIIVSYVIYKLIMLIRGTRAEQLIKGLFILLLAMIVSDKIGLKTLNWILEKVMTVGLIAIPIVFQPELRRALEQLGRGKIFQRPFRSWDYQKFDYFLEELMKAVPALVKKRIGALIVIEQETGLNDWVETGIVIDGLISAELLINIFFPRSPLHDGAVIIRGNQVVAAGCYLPFTDDPLLDKELGARHRAGIGITEQSDAVALIISDETGVVSLAHGGVLTQYLEGEELRGKLTELCVTERSEGLNLNFWPWRNSK